MSRRLFAFVRGAAILALTLLLALLTAAPVAAHAELVSSSPQAGQTLSAPPSAVTMHFSEDVAPKLSHFFLTLPGGTRTEVPAEVQGQAVTLNISSLVTQGATATGNYVVDGQVIAADDGHQSTMRIGFAVQTAGQTSGPAGSAAAPGRSPTSPGSPLWIILIIASLKWLQLAGLAAMTGPALFDLLWRRAVQHGLLGGTGSATGEDAARVLAPRLRRLAVWGAILLLAAAVLQPVVQAVAAGGLSLVWVYLTTTGVGQAVGVRGLAAVAVLLLAFIGPTETQPPSGAGGPASPLGWPRWVLLLAAVAAASFTLLSHQMSGGWLPGAFDFLHTLGTTIWAGGLLALAVQPWGGAGGAGRASSAGVRLWGEAAVPVIVEFSSLATAAILAVSVSGIYAAVTNIPTMPALRENLYGETLLVKLSLFAVLAGVAAVNHFWLVPRLHRLRPDPDPAAHRLLVVLVRLEAGLIVAVLFFASLLSSLPRPLPPGGGG
ncbi:MAG: copper resistance CopC/CopD family protein [Symbiobacteriia bacterium]